MSRPHSIQKQYRNVLKLVAAVEALESRRMLDMTAARFLLGDTDPAPVANVETGVQITAGNGNYLAVWADRRSMLGTERQAPLNAGWPGGGTDSDIFAALLDGNGQLIGTSFAIYMGGRADTVPQVDFNGSQFLVTWISVPEGDPYGLTLRAARVSQTGQLLDTNSILVAASDSAAGVTLSSAPAAMTHDPAGNWLVAYGRTTDVESSVMGRRISPTGALLGAAPTQLKSGDAYVDTAFFHDGRFVISSYPGFSPVQLRAFDTSLAFVSQTTVPHEGQIASNGNNMYLVWSDNASPNPTLAAFGSRVSDAGALLDGAVQLTSSHQYSPRAQVSWDGANWQVVTLRAFHHALVTHVAPSGAVLNPGGTIFADAPQALDSFDSASRAGTTVATFIDQSISSGSQDISAAAMRADNTVSPRGMISIAARNQMNVDLATGPGGFLSVYKDLESGHHRILAQRLDTAGHSIGSEPVLLSEAPDYATSPHVSFNGEVYMVVWYQQSGDALTGFLTGTYMRRLDINGQPLDAAPVLVTTSQYAPDVAAVGNEFLLVSHFSNSFTGYTTWRRYNSAGQMVATNNISYAGPHTVKQLEVIAVNDRWLVLTENHYVADAFAQLNLTWIDRAGNQTTTIDVGTGQGRSYAPHLATSGNNVLMVYDHKTDGSYQDVWARIIGLDNSLGTPFKIGVNGTDNSSQSEAHVAWNGNEYVAAWIDHRNKQYPLQPEGDIYGARISETGVILDPDGVPVASTASPDDAPTVNFGHGITLLGYSTFNPAVSAGSMRIAVREIFSPLRVTDNAYQPATPNVRLQFSGDVSASLTPSDLVLTNLDTGAAVPTSALDIAYDTWLDAASIRYRVGSEVAALPDANYRLTIPAGAIVSASGQPLGAAAVFNFRVLTGDADGNGVIDFDDYVAIDHGFLNGLTGYTNGDFNRDGVIDFDDYVLIDQAFNTQG